MLKYWVAPNSILPIFYKQTAQNYFGFQYNTVLSLAVFLRDKYMRKIFLFLHLFFSTTLFAQVTDDFSDGDFTKNPVWSGNTAYWEVLNGQLHAIDSVSNTWVYLSTPSTIASGVQWEFLINLKYNTSSVNYVDVFLTSDSANLRSTSSNGYFVMLGNTTDEVSLYRKNGTTITKIIDGVNGVLNHSNNLLKIKITRTFGNLWTLQLDSTGTGNNYFSEGAIIDSTFTTSSYFGILVAQSTSSFFGKQFFDNFSVDPIIIDKTSPTIDSVKIISSTKLDILFSESVDKKTAETISNYSVNNGIGNPITALRDTSNQSLVHLTFTTAFTDGLKNTITINNIQDTIGNIISTNISKDFTFSLPVIVKFLDVVINEIMADPDPPVALPNYEYVELYNRTNVPINLNKWTFSTSTMEVVIPNVTIFPNDFLILCSSSAKSLLQSFGNTVGIGNFPSITNSGTTLILKDNLQRIISTVSYTDVWYQNAQKKDGGWSLEQIDVDKPCMGMSNWKASTNENGGTPGKKNSVDGITSDSHSPYILRASAIDSMHIQVFFSKPMDSSSIMNPVGYEIDNNIGKPTSLKLVAPTYELVVLTLAQPIQKNVIYTVSVSDTIQDCAGNPDLTVTAVKFAIPLPVDSLDIVINEILFDPKEGGYDFVEIYNRSNKIIDLKDLRLASGDYVTAKLDDIKEITTTNYLMFPQDYLVCTISYDALNKQYSINKNNLIELSFMPAFNVDYDIVALTTVSGKVIDRFKYTATMHFPLLNDTKGVSLERLNFDRITQDSTNWHSASEAVDFATPGYKNSQYTDGEKIENPITITPEIFSPDNDGHNDVVNINYRFDTPGYVGNIGIYDAKGRLIRYLVKNELLGNDGSFTWDGITETKEKARIGIYIVSFEVFEVKGNVKQYKKSCVLGGKL